MPTDSPLEEVAGGLGAAGPRLFLKREDLLPFGGGVKVRRSLPLAADGDPRPIAVLSDRGAHTFKGVEDEWRLYALER